NESSELTLITNYLDNVMKNVFHVPDKHIVRWPNTTLTESKVRKFDGSRTKQPDFVVSVNYQSRATNVIFVGEVTGPTEKNNVYKNCLDLIRIGVFMKDCIDSAISQGVDIKILGFQCIAYKIDFYILDINGEGLYMMNHIAQISVPATIKDICSFIDELYILLNLRSILYESYNAFVDKLKNPRLAPLELKSSFKKPTLDTPEFNKLVSKTRCVKRECPFWFGRYKYVFSFQNNLKFTILILIAIVDDNNSPSEEHGARFTNLEQKDKEKTNLIAKLEQNDKEKTDLIAKLEYDVSLIKGQDKSMVCNQIVTNVSQDVEPRISDSYPDTYISNIKSSIPPEQKKEQGLIQEISTSIKDQNDITRISQNNIRQNHMTE
ncbi:1704_t:CDS:2, partial [Dentiscutata heterogama]